MTDPSATVSPIAPRQKARDEIKAVALAEFSAAGYAGTSLQRIADLAGYSKSAVLYHFDSKEALLEASLGPAIDGMEALLGSSVPRVTSVDDRERFIAAFIDFLLQYRLEVHVFINQGQSLVDVPIVARANGILSRLSGELMTGLDTEEQRVRFGVALGGAAFILVASMIWVVDKPQNLDETRAALITVVTELISPVTPTSH